MLVVTAPGSGAEIIPFLKTWVNLPMAIGFTIMYSAVSMHLQFAGCLWLTVNYDSHCRFDFDCHTIDC